MGRTLDKAQIAALPLGWFTGTIHVVDSAQSAAEAFAWLGGESVLGFDTETRPSFRRGERHPVALLQLASEQHAVLVQLQRAGIPPELREIIESKRIVKAAQAPAEEVRALNATYAVKPECVIDVEILMRQARLIPSSVRGQAAHFLGIRVSKGAQTSNWERPRLSLSQQRYAATDAWVCRHSYLQLSRPKAELGGS